jgi:ferredoxin--NADP+ reductase
VISNKKGRIINQENGDQIPGLYTAGWIKRGPSSIIGTNKLDALETLKCMLRDIQNGVTLNPEQPTSNAAEMMVRERQPEYSVFDEWLKLDRRELARGKEMNRPRAKFTTIDTMLTEVDY